MGNAASKTARTAAVLTLLSAGSGAPPTSPEAPSVGTATQSAPFSLEPLPYRVDEAALPFEPEPGSQAHWGTTPRGAGYRIELPDDWGGDLMVFLRGGGELCNVQTGEGCVLEFGPDPLRPHLVSRGVAWATTTYSDYRLAPALRARDALDLVELFEKRFRKAERVFVWGRSFGGVATLTALELYPERFAGALPTCTGLPVEGFTAFYDLNLVALALAAPSDPELAAALAEFSLPVDLADWTTRIAPKIVTTLGLNSAGSETAEASVLREVVRRTSGGDRPTFDTAFEQSVGPMLFGYLGIEVPAAVGGRSFIDNSATQYRWESDEGAPLSGAEAELNRRIPRFACDPGVCFEPGPAFASGPFGGFPRHTGRIEAPVIFLQNTGDLTAQFDGAQLYAERVDAQGRSRLLVQRAIRATRHCSFHDAELSEAFDDLVRWLDTGARPGGDDFRNPDEVANPAFGCRFTRGAHDHDTAFEQVCR
jgi:pimeloyl-ACP methyl ester carboxylesterase